MNDPNAWNCEDDGCEWIPAGGSFVKCRYCGKEVEIWRSKGPRERA